MKASEVEYCLFWLDWWWSCMTRGEWASWVQAIGSLVAIGSAAFAVWWQVHKQTRLQMDARVAEESRLLQIIGQFVFEVRAKFRDLEEHDLPHMHSDWTAIDAPIASIRAVSFDRYPVEEAAFAVGHALLSYEFTRATYARYPAGAYGRDDVVRIDTSRRQTLAAFFRAEQAIDDALKSRGARLKPMQIDFGGGVVIRTLQPNLVS